MQTGSELDQVYQSTRRTAENFEKAFTGTGHRSTARQNASQQPTQRIKLDKGDLIAVKNRIDHLERKVGG